MPRQIREKDSTCINYIVISGISDVLLFRDDSDREEYISLLIKYRNIYGFRLYAYCLLDNFAHFIIDPFGADISSIMSSINTGYSERFNRKYHRHGYVFNDRFKNKLIKDDFELKATTLYIHNSAAQIKEYENHPEKYPYSSLGVYIGLEDHFNAVDKDFVNEFMGDSLLEREKYLALVPQYDIKKLTDEIKKYNKDTGERYRCKPVIPNVDPEEIISFISEHTGVSKMRLQSKYAKDPQGIRMVTAFVLKNFYHLKSAIICRVLGGITQATASKYFYAGFKLVEENKEYSELVNEINKRFIG